MHKKNYLMRKKNASSAIILPVMIFIITFSQCALLFGQDKGIFTDPRDGHIYSWVVAGKYAWMTGNLHFKTASGSWIYNNDSTKEAIYGRLYDWTTALKACPKGWRLPTDDDWQALITSLGGEDLAGEKLARTDSIPKFLLASTPGEKDNFTSLLGGVRHNDGTFTGLGLWGGCWSATHTNDVYNNFLFTRNGKSVGKSSNDKGTAFSVKCVRKK